MVRASNASCFFIRLSIAQPIQITRWKQDLIANAPDLFGKGTKKEVNHEAEVAELHRQIGKLKVENDFLSNLPGLNLTGRRNRK